MQFLGLKGSACRYEESRVVILPIPYERSVTFGRGAGRAPRAILEASREIESYDEYFRAETWRPSLHTREPLLIPGPPEKAAELIERETSSILEDGKIPLCLGGEHSVSFGAVKAAGRFHRDLSVLSLDAHADMRHRYGGLELNHATVMRRISELFPLTAAGVRSISREEVEFLEKAGDRVSVLFRRDMIPLRDRIPELLDRLTGHVYLSIDVDVLDPSIVPETGTPEPGGLDWFELNEILDRLTRHRTVVACDVVEFAPRPGEHAGSAIMARLILRLVGFLTRNSGSRSG